MFLASRDVSNPYTAGGDITMYRVASKLAEQGHRVDYVCSRANGMAASDDRNGLRIHRLGGPYSTSPRFFVSGRSLRDGADAIVEEVVGGIRVPYLSAFYAEGPRVCFWYQRNARLFSAQYGRGVGTILGGLETLVGRVYSRTAILTCSIESKEALSAIGIPESNIHVYYPGLPEPLIRLADTQEVRRENLLLCIGKFRRYKSLHHAIRVLSEAKKAPGLADLRLVVAGRREDARYERFMHELASQLGVADSVSFETNVSEGRKAELLARAAILLIPSPIEGFGRTAIEANLFGVPVIGTLGVPRDVIREGYNGYRVPFGDIGAFASIVDRLMSDDRERDMLSGNGREFARQFTWQGTMRVVEEVLKRIGIEPPHLPSPRAPP